MYNITHSCNIILSYWKLGWWEGGYKIQNKAWLSQLGLSSAWPLLPPNSWKLVTHYLGLLVLPAVAAGGRLAVLKLRID